MTEEPEELYLCANADFESPFDDNVEGHCECGQAIIWRPHAPKHMKKVCFKCAAKVAEEVEAQGGAIKHMATPEVLAEVQTFFAKGTKH